MKPGYKTTEFWITLGTSIVTFALSIGLVTLADAASLNEAIKQIGVSLGSLLAAAMVIVKYIQGRTEQKKAQADLLMAQHDERAAAFELELAKVEEGKK